MREAAVLGQVATSGHLELPRKRPGKPVGTRTRVPHTERGDPGELVEAELGSIGPLVLEQVRSIDQRLLFRELVGRLEAVELTGTPERTASNLVPGYKRLPIRYRIAPAT